jgi:uncharacterized protein YjbI with pentapeptide repeats
MEPTLKTKLSNYSKIAGIMLLIALPLTGLAIRGYSVPWTGFGKSLDGSLQAKTLWDWMDLLLVPLFLAGGILLLNRSRRDMERQHVEEHAALEREIAVDHQRATALQAYIDRMSELLLKDKLSRFSPDEVRNVAKSRTLTVLRSLDSKRRGSVLLFLKDSGLIDREAVIDMSSADLRGAYLMLSTLSRVNLSQADLSGADLRGADLSKSFLGETNLSKADLSGANLSGTDLFESNLNGANLSQTKLSKANLNGADLRGCRLHEADLRDADLSGVNLNVGDLVGANLRGAKLGGAKLLGADLREADLSQADLSGTQITETEWEKAKSLEGAIMPDGTKHN